MYALFSTFIYVYSRANIIDIDQDLTVTFIHGLLLLWITATV